MAAPVDRPSAENRPGTRRGRDDQRGRPDVRRQPGADFPDSGTAEKELGSIPRGS